MSLSFLIFTFLIKSVNANFGDRQNFAISTQHLDRASVNRGYHNVRKKPGARPITRPIPTENGTGRRKKGTYTRHEGHTEKNTNTVNQPKWRATRPPLPRQVTRSPTSQPIDKPTLKPTTSITLRPTTAQPTPEPTVLITLSPTVHPTFNPTPKPTGQRPIPTKKGTYTRHVGHEDHQNATTPPEKNTNTVNRPKLRATRRPYPFPRRVTRSPTFRPKEKPTLTPTTSITSRPTTAQPTPEPTVLVTLSPTVNPTLNPTPEPTGTDQPTTIIPTLQPSNHHPTPSPTSLSSSQQPSQKTNPATPPTTASPTRRRTSHPTPIPTTTTPSPTKQIPTTTTTPLELIQVGNTIHGDEAFDYSGKSISLSANGMRLAVGVGRHDPAGVEDAGQVRIFQRGAAEYDDWMALGSFFDGSREREELGLDVSLSGDGNWLAISNIDPGEATMYQYVGSSWVQKGNSVEGTQIQLSNDGSRLVVGGYLFGQLYEYSQSSNDWVKLGNELYQTNLTHVDISGNGRRFVLACPEASDTNNAGVVRVYNYDASNGVQQIGQILFGDEQDLFGWSLSMSYDGNVLAVGSWGGNYVRIFKYDEMNNHWDQIGRDIVGNVLDEFEFGYSVSLTDDGERVAVGSPLYDNKKGRIAVYRLKNGSSWEFADQAVGLSTDDWEGEDIAFSPEGDYVAVSAVLSDDEEKNTVDAGHVRVFECVVKPT